MACYKPLVFWRDEERKTKNGKPYLHFAGSFSESDDNYRMLEQGSLVSVPCGKCIGCRLDYARHWADRMILEYEACKKAVFVTLTYDEENLPKIIDKAGDLLQMINEAGAPVAPLRKQDMSKFMKSLRSKYKDNGYDVKIRFFGCGEYGEKRHRPHFHIILFGVDLQDLCVRYNRDVIGKLIPWVRNELGQVSFRSDFLEDVWKKGIVAVSDTSYETMGYVARYSLKKAKGSSYPENWNLPEEFTLMSRMPGIGAPFLEKYPGKVDEVSTWYVKGKDIYWPKYLLEKEHLLRYDIERIDPYDNTPLHEVRFEPDQFLKEIRESRRRIALNKFLSTYENDERPYFEKQLFLERQKVSSADKLLRGDVALY